MNLLPANLHARPHESNHREPYEYLFQIKQKAVNRYGAAQFLNQQKSDKSIKPKLAAQYICSGSRLNEYETQQFLLWLRQAQLTFHNRQHREFLLLPTHPNDPAHRQALQVSYTYGWEH